MAETPKYRNTPNSTAMGTRLKTSPQSKVVPENVQYHLVKVPIAANWKMYVYKIQVNPIHTILKYGVIIMILWIGNSAVLKSSSQWQLKEF